MSEWKNFSLGDLATFKTGKLNSNAAEKDGKYPFFTCSPEPLKINAYSFDQQAILLAGNNAEGNFHIKYYEGKFDAYQRTYVFSARPSCHLKFLYYSIKLCLEDFKRISLGTATKFLTAKILNGFIISLPPLETQKKIAAVLSALDDKIELNNAINKNLEEQAQTIYKKICLKAPLVPLSELIETIESGSRPKGGAETSGIPSIGAEKIDGFGRYDYSNEKFISADYFKRLKRGIVFSGDVMLYKDGAYTGKSSMALDGFPHETCAVNEHVFLLRTKDNMAQFFLYFTLRNEDVYKKIHALACGKAAQPGLNQKELMCVTSFLPEEEVIQKFESIVSPLMRTIALNALENKKLAEIRDALLPRLMSGEIDVSNVKI